MRGQHALVAQPITAPAETSCVCRRLNKSMKSLIYKPILIIGANRSGTTLLFRILSSHPMAWSLYDESQQIWYRHYSIHPDMGDRIVERPPMGVIEDIQRAFYLKAHNKEYFKEKTLLNFMPLKLIQRSFSSLYKKPPLRLIEKTPANCFRIPFLLQVFPDAKFIFLIRRGEDVISSLMEGWKYWSRTQNNSWTYSKWHYLVPPGWQDWKDRRLEEICAFQWTEANKIAWTDLNVHCPGRFLLVRHEDLMKSPGDCYNKILEYSELPVSKYFDRQVARIRGRFYTSGGSSPRPGKWRELYLPEIESINHMIEPMNRHFYPDLPLVRQ